MNPSFETHDWQNDERFQAGLCTVLQNVNEQDREEVEQQAKLFIGRDWTPSKKWANLVKRAPKPMTTPKARPKPTLKPTTTPTNSINPTSLALPLTNPIPAKMKNRVPPATPTSSAHSLWQTGSRYPRDSRHAAGRRRRVQARGRAPKEAVETEDVIIN